MIASQSNLQKMILCINTAIPERHVALVDPSVKAIHELPLKTGQESESILAAIDSLFKKSKITVRDLTGIAIITGPGGFTSLRVGVTIANTFAHELKIPIFGITSDEWEKLPKETPEEKWFSVCCSSPLSKFREGPGVSLEPDYGRPPVITPPKTGSMRPPRNIVSSS